MKSFKLLFNIAISLAVTSTVLAHDHHEHNHIHWGDILLGLGLISIIFLIWYLFLKKNKAE